MELWGVQLQGAFSDHLRFAKRLVIIIIIIIIIIMVRIFFFKQKTAYEIGVRLVGSEMCIRDSKGALGGGTPNKIKCHLIVMKFLPFIKICPRKTMEVVQTFWVHRNRALGGRSDTVSYTHLTLPTKA